MTNFDYLTKEPKFKSFSGVAIAAERVFQIDKETSIINCRRAMEFAIKWMYSVDQSLEMPYQDKLVSLMSTEDFHDLVDNDLWKRLDLIRRIGNRAAHNGRKISEDEARLCLQNLFIFMDYLSYCYSDFYEEREYDESLLEEKQEAPAKVEDTQTKEVDLKALIAENKALKEELTARRHEKQDTYVPKPLDLSEYKTRKIYIDAMLLDAGWTEGKDWINEVELPGMPNKSQVGFADYVLYDDSHRPLAVVEAKRTCVDVAKGRQQAKLYADLLEEKYKRRPVVFLTNGFETRIIDNQYPERKWPLFIPSGIWKKCSISRPCGPAWPIFQWIRTSRDATIRRRPSGRCVTVLIRKTAGKRCLSWPPDRVRRERLSLCAKFFCRRVGSKIFCSWRTGIRW